MTVNEKRLPGPESHKLMSLASLSLKRVTRPWQSSQLRVLSTTQSQATIGLQRKIERLLIQLHSSITFMDTDVMTLGTISDILLRARLLTMQQESVSS